MTQPKRFADLAQQALDALAGPARQGLFRILGVWDEAVGPEVARAVRPVRFKDGILTLEVVSPVWAQQLALLAGRLTGAVNASLGEDMVRELRFSPQRGPRKRGGK